jgi:simple sugar transport system ATP-binding protein
MRLYARDAVIRLDPTLEPLMDAPADSLTNAEKQRCCLARELDGNPEVLIALFPSQGLRPEEAKDVWERLLSFRDGRRTVLALTGDMREALACSGRILVLCRGEITGEFEPALTSERELSLYMTGERRQGAEETFDEE